MFILKANNPSVIMDEETFFCCLAVFAFLRFITWKPSLVYLEVSFSWKSSSVYITIERYLWSPSAFATIRLSCKIPTYVTSVTICKKKKKRFTYLHRIKKKGSSVPCLHLRCALSVWMCRISLCVSTWAFRLQWIGSVEAWGYVTMFEVELTISHTLFLRPALLKNYPLWRKQTAHWLCSLLSACISRLLTSPSHTPVPPFPSFGTQHDWYGSLDWHKLVTTLQQTHICLLE